MRRKPLLHQSQKQAANNDAAIAEKEEGEEGSSRG